MDELDRTQLEEVLKLAKDNNRMLHSMRRSAFIGGLFRIIVWVALIAAPLWFYATYLAPVMQNMNAAMNSMQGSGAAAQEQLADLQKALSDLQNLTIPIPSFLKPQ